MHALSDDIFIQFQRLVQLGQFGGRELCVKQHIPGDGNSRDTAKQDDH